LKLKEIWAIRIRL
jgi:integrase